MRALLLLLLLLLACTRAPRDVSLVAPERAYSVEHLAEKAPLTVAVFVSAECPCLHAHLERLRGIAAEYAPRGVQFVGVDSEVGGSLDRAKKIERDLALPFPVLVDTEAAFADAVGAEYATYTVVLDREGRVRYRGGIDSDKRKMHDDATAYLRDALDDLLAGRAPRRTQGKALGCVLRKW